jgi:anti-sigma B factor antagonist
MTTAETSRIIVVAEGDPVRISVRGALDLASASDLDDAFVSLGALHPPLVLLDLAGVTFFDSSGLRALMRVTSRCEELGTTVRLLDPPPQTRRVMEVTGTLDRFEIGEEPVGG